MNNEDVVATDIHELALRFSTEILSAADDKFKHRLRGLNEEMWHLKKVIIEQEKDKRDMLKVIKDLNVMIDALDGINKAA